MSLRVGGAVLALIAAALLAVSIATSAWWLGPPEMGGKVYHRKNVHIGLIQAHGCDIADEVETSCKTLSVGTAFTVTKYIELAAVGALALGLIGLGITALMGSNRKRVFAKIALGAAGAGAIVAVGLLLQGPEIETKTVAVPIGYGMLLFFGGTGLGIVAGIIAPMAARAKKQSAPAAWATQPPAVQQQQQQQLVDALSFLQNEDTLRPASLGPEPVMNRAAVPSPGGMLAGPSGPLAPVTHSNPAQPLFSGAPQLRPLYDAMPNQGGTGGFVPEMAAPVLPSRGPTPLPQAAVGAMAPGLPTPPPMAAALPPPQSAVVNLPPAGRNKPASISPPLPRPTSPRSQPTLASAAVPPPTAIPVPPIIPPVVPPRPAPSGVPTTPSTLAGVVPPRAETDPEANAETIDRDFDAAATVNRDQPRADSVLDPSLYTTGDSTSPSVPFETVTNESRSSVAFETATGESRPSVPFETATAESRPFSSEQPTDVSRLEDSVDEQAETVAREKVDPAALKEPERPSAAILTSAPAPAKKLAISVPDIPPVPPKKPPISTAPDSLPPPTTQQSATSGPSPACPQCEAPMAWVEEHLRFYCKSCRMYF